MNNDESTLLQYLKSKERSHILTTVIIKIILSAIAAVALTGSASFDISTVLVGCLAFAFVYDVCCLYQFSLYLTRNQIVAAIMCLVLLCGIGYLYDILLSKLPWINAQYSMGVEAILIIFIVLIFLIPLILNIRSIIKLSKV